MLKVLQIKLHHSKVASANLLLLLIAAHYDVVLIQEPWTSKASVCGLRTPIYTLIAHATARCRACILIRKNLNFFFLKTFSDSDLVAIPVGMDGDWIRLGSGILSQRPRNIYLSEIIFFPKAGKKSHTAPKDLRPISLCSFMLDNMEPLIDLHLQQ